MKAQRACHYVVATFRPLCFFPLRLEVIIDMLVTRKVPRLYALLVSAWLCLLRSVKSCVLSISVPRNWQRGALQSNRRSIMPMKIAIQRPEARTTMMGITWLSDTLVTSDSTLVTFSSSVLINPVRSMECNLKFKYLFIVNGKAVEQISVSR